MIAITLATLCEFAWVLSRSYRRKPEQIAAAIAALSEVSNATMDRAAVEEGLRFLAAGGDFADGVIAREGFRLGGDTYLTFDRGATSVASRAGRLATLLQSS